MAPINDNFADAISIAGQDGSINGTTVAATESDSADWPSNEFWFGEGSVWYRWVCPQSNRYTFVLTGAIVTSTFEPLITAYTGTNFADLIGQGLSGGAFVEDDNSMTFYAHVGRTYWIEVDQYENGAFTGHTFTLTWHAHSCTGPPDAPTTPGSITNIGYSAALVQFEANSYQETGDPDHTVKELRVYRGASADDVNTLVQSWEMPYWDAAFPNAWTAAFGYTNFSETPPYFPAYYRVEAVNDCGTSSSRVFPEYFFSLELPNWDIQYLAANVHAILGGGGYTPWAEGIDNVEGPIIAATSGAFGARPKGTSSSSFGGGTGSWILCNSFVTGLPLRFAGLVIQAGMAAYTPGSEVPTEISYTYGPQNLGEDPRMVTEGPYVFETDGYGREDGKSVKCSYRFDGFHTDNVITSLGELYDPLYYTSCIGHTWVPSAEKESFAWRCLRYNEFPDPFVAEGALFSLVGDPELIGGYQVSSVSVQDSNIVEFPIFFESLRFFDELTDNFSFFVYFIYTGSRSANFADKPVCTLSWNNRSQMIYNQGQTGTFDGTPPDGDGLVPVAINFSDIVEPQGSRTPGTVACGILIQFQKPIMTAHIDHNA